MAENATVNIPKDILEPIVRAQVTAGIMQHFGKPEEIIRKVVEASLARKVNSNGDVSSSNYENSHDLIEVLSSKVIHKIAKEMLTEFLETQRPVIEKHMRAQFAKKASPFAKAAADGLMQAMKSEWSFKCNVSMPRD